MKKMSTRHIRIRLRPTTTTKKKPSNFKAPRKEHADTQRETQKERQVRETETEKQLQRTNTRKIRGAAAFSLETVHVKRLKQQLSRIDRKEISDLEVFTQQKYLLKKQKNHL